MSAVTDFFAMGGYAVYVWVSYALTLLGMAGLIWVAIHRYKTAMRRLERLQIQDAAELKSTQSQQDGVTAA